MGTQLVALVGEISGTPLVKHFRGIPPELAGGTDDREILLSPAVLVIEEKLDGIFLFRFMRDGSCVGDTWHLTVEDAKQQAEYEYGIAPSEWKQVPTEIVNAVTFALEQAQ
jgi:hypothetical protein